PERPPGALPLAVRARDQDDGPVEALDQPRRDDPDHALVPVLAREDVAASPARRLGPGLHLRDRRAEDPVLDRLPVAIQLLELRGEPVGLVAILRQQELERGAGAAEPARGVDPRCETEPD